MKFSNSVDSELKFPNFATTFFILNSEILISHFFRNEIGIKFPLLKKNQFFSKSSNSDLIGSILTPVCTNS